MKIHLFAVGEKMPAWVKQAYHEYAKRLPGECELKLHEIAMQKRGKNSSPLQALEKEGQAILKAIPNGAHVVALHINGQAWSTEQLCQNLQSWMQAGQDLALLIGGPDGLSRPCLERAQQQWSLSKLTFPHPLVRVIVAESIYRAWSLFQNHPYHRGS